MLIRGKELRLIAFGYEERQTLAKLNLSIKHVDRLRGRDTKLAKDRFSAALSSGVNPGTEDGGGRHVTKRASLCPIATTSLRGSISLTLI